MFKIAAEQVPAVFHVAKELYLSCAFYFRRSFDVMATVDRIRHVGIWYVQQVMDLAAVVTWQQLTDICQPCISSMDSELLANIRRSMFGTGDTLRDG